MMMNDVSVDGTLTDRFRASMRLAAASISLVTARDGSGKRHGMAVTSATSLSMDPLSMMVAVNRTASIHPVIAASSTFCLNLMTEDHGAILERFSRSDMREMRFATDDWSEGLHGLPVLRGALASHLCTVVAAHDFGTHTVFFGQVDDVVLPGAGMHESAPLVWRNGERVSIRSRVA
ncbi:flavin reductase family protein [Xinfangfangia sp. D13-10-4-6]|uniref:flavin reductase family protein n=1 Tax=Pseudogemmobacter hezensis TaxID=2737662 RepID=UPI001557F24D|nr:flavin reductase family protein [Pseudogemmobacter hezensis]NPD14990.1 flavin reductase family protein [Pseudogemmobacter hezensis]